MCSENNNHIAATVVWQRRNRRSLRKYITAQGTRFTWGQRCFRDNVRRQRNPHEGCLNPPRKGVNNGPPDVGNVTYTYAPKILRRESTEHVLAALGKDRQVSRRRSFRHWLLLACSTYDHAYSSTQALGRPHSSLLSETRRVAFIRLSPSLRCPA